MRIIPFKIVSVQFTEQIAVNNFYLFIRKYLEHPRLEHLGIPVHWATQRKSAKLLLMQLEVRDKGNSGMLRGGLLQHSLQFVLWCMCRALWQPLCWLCDTETIIPERVWVLFWTTSLELQSRTWLCVRQAEPRNPFHCDPSIPGTPVP